MSSASWSVYGDVTAPPLAGPPAPAPADHLEFRGTDSSECETFINAVSRQALAAGRQRDDQWTADFAGSCFTKGALRWYDRLDEETQSSWRALRRAMLVRYRPMFYGKSGEDAEAFLRTLRDRAVDEGKVGSSEWYGDAFAVSLGGDASSWYWVGGAA